MKPVSNIEINLDHAHEGARLWIDARKSNSLFDAEDIYVSNSGDYYKDVDNNFDPFIGEWKWENGNRFFTIQLKKLVNLYDSEQNFSES